MDYCQNCGEPLSEKTRFCPNCGKECPIAAPVYAEAEFIMEEPQEEPAETSAAKAQEPAPAARPKPASSPKPDMPEGRMSPPVGEPSQKQAPVSAPKQEKKPSGVKKALYICFLAFIALGIIGRIFFMPSLLNETGKKDPSPSTATQAAKQSIQTTKKSADSERPTLPPASSGMVITSPRNEFDLVVILSGTGWKHTVDKESIRISRINETSSNLARIALVSQPLDSLTEAEKSPENAVTDCIRTALGDQAILTKPQDALIAAKYNGCFRQGKEPGTGNIMRCVSWLAGDRIYLAALYMVGEQQDAQTVLNNIQMTFRLAP